MSQSRRRSLRLANKCPLQQNSSKHSQKASRKTPRLYVRLKQKAKPEKKSPVSDTSDYSPEVDSELWLFDSLSGETSTNDKGNNVTNSRLITKPLNVQDFIKAPPIRKKRNVKTVKYCIPSCRHKGLDTAEGMLRCCICMRWVHPVSCCGDNKKDVELVGIYSCIVCRGLSDRLANIEKTIANLQDTNKTLIRLLEDKENECSSLRKLLAEKTTSADPQSDLPLVTNEVRALPKRDKPIPAPRSKTSLNINSKKPKVTVLGTSMVRGSGPELAKCLGTKNTMVYSISGLSLESAAAKSNDIFKDHRQGDVAAIQIGTADLLTHNVSQLESKYSDLLSIIKSSAPECKLIVNAVPRRLPSRSGSGMANQRADQLNDFLRKRCTMDKQLVFLDPNPVLSTTYYEKDGLHLNGFGLNYFSKFLCSYKNHCENFPIAENVAPL